ncbi:MAG: tyrosine-type recombinase/integrase [Thermaerobacter sp.]|nr:tyrosine-type recombinase/integrase [Thermaerobacter sp.]
MLYSEAVDLALAELGARSRCRQTVAAYRADLRLYGRFCSERTQVSRSDLALEACAALGVERYLMYLRAERRNAPATIARRLAAVRALYRAVWRLAGLSRDPSREVAYPGGPRRGVRALRVQEAQSLVRAATAASRTPLRDALMLLLLVSNGLTLAELTALNCDDIDLARRVMRVSGRPQAERTVPLSSDAAALLRRYLRTLPAASPLWGNRTGGRLSARGVQYVCARAAHRAGLARPVSAQALRVTALQLMRAAGASEATIRALLGLRRAG